MTSRSKKTSGVTRALVSGLAAVYFLTNVAAVHAAENNFWSERRRAASLQWGEPDAATPSRGGDLYARLPTAPSQGPDLSSLWEQPVHRVSQDLAQSSTAHIARAPDTRLMAVAQAVAPFGQVRRVKTAGAPEGPLVLHIQDVHGNVEAQRNMSGMVLALAQKQSPLVGLEGATGAFDTDSFHAYPDADIVKSVADFFLEKDLIGGPEHAALVASKSITLWGVEDPALYLSHVDAVKASLASRARADALAAEWTAVIEELKQKHFSSALRDYDKNQSLYEQDKRGLGEYVETLKGFHKSGTKSTDALPNVEKLLVAARREKTMDFDTVENERRSLVEGLAARLSVPELQDLVRRSLDLKSGAISQRAYQTHLRALCARHQLDLSRYPRLTDYMTYVADSESIERDALLDELARLETAAQDVLVQTPTHRALVTLSRDLSRFKKVIANEMTPADWSAYEPRRAEIAKMGQRLGEVAGGRAVPGPADWDAFIGPYEGFCRKALARNAALADRLLEKMKTDRKTTAVLVAGGFHTDGLVDLLAARGATVAVLTPKIGPVDGTANYLDVFSRDPLPVEEIFAGEPIALKAICGLAGGALAGEQTARVHAAVAGKTLMVALEDLRGLGHGARMIMRELRERLLAMAQEVTGLALIQPQVHAVGADGLTFSYRAPNGREETVQFRSADDGVTASGSRKTGPMAWLRGVWAIVSRPRPAGPSSVLASKALPVSEGSFFQVREIDPGKLAKEVKEVVGPRGDVQYRLSESDRERLAQLTVEYADRIRESVAQASGGRVVVSRFERKGRVLLVDRAPGAPRTTETADDRKAYLDAMRGADNALGLDGLNAPIYTPDGWRIHVDRGSQNLFYSEDGKTVTWIDPVTVWPPADRRLTVSPEATVVAAPSATNLLMKEWGVAWRESFGFLRPLAFHRAHSTWTGAQRALGALLIAGMWVVMGETASVFLDWAQRSWGAPLVPSLALGLALGWVVTIPLHAGWNLAVEGVNDVLARRGVSTQLPRLSVHEDLAEEFEAVESNLKILREGVALLDKGKGHSGIRLQVVELYLQSIDRLTRLMADMEKYLPKGNVQKFRSRLFQNQDWLPSAGKIIGFIDLVGREGNFQTAHGFLGQISKYPDFVTPLDAARLKETQNGLRREALRVETQRMKGTRPNGKQVRAIASTLALTKAQEHWLDVYAALEREGVEVSFERMAAVGKRSSAEYQRLWDEDLGEMLADNWNGAVKPLPGDATLRDDLEAALEIHSEEEPTTEGFLKQWPTPEDFARQIARTANVSEPLAAMWLNLAKKGEYAKLVKRLTSASPMVIVDQEGVEWRVMSPPGVFEKFKPSMADTVSRLARKLIELGDGAQTRGAEYSRRGILREKWATSWWIFGKKFSDQKTLMIYWFGSGAEAHAPGDSYAANKDVERKVFENADHYDFSNAVAVMSDLTEARVKSPPAGAWPRGVDWLKARGHDTASAIRKAPWIESGLFSVAFLIPFALAMAGVDGSTWAAGGVYSLMNAYFGLQHTRAYRSVSGQWVEGPSSWRTKAWLAAVGMVVHLPLLALALNPLTGPIGTLAMYAGGALASVALHRLYNAIAAKTGWPAATRVTGPAVERKTRIQNMMRTLIQFSKRVGNNTSPETPEEAAAIENATAVQIYRGLSNLGQRNPQGSQWRIALSLEERRSLLSFLLAEMELLNRLLVKATNDLAAIDSQRSFAGNPLVKTSESNRLRTEIKGIHQEILPALQIVGMLGEGADREFRDSLIYRMVGIVSHPMVDVNLRESFSRFLAERMIRDDDSVAGEVLFDSLVPAETSLPGGREFWKAIFTDAWPVGETPSRLFSLLQADNRTHRRLGLALLSFHGNAEERLANLIQSSEVPTAFRLAALNRLTQMPKVSEATIQNISSLVKSAEFIRATESYLTTQADDSQWTADLFESPLFAAEDGKAFLTGVAVLLGGKLDMADWSHFQSVGRNIDQARFLSFWDNAHAQMSFGGSMFRSYYGGVKYSGRLLTMVAAHEMVHAFLQSENFGYETVTQKRFHEYMSDMGTESIRDTLRFSLGDMMSYAQTTGFFESGDGGVNNQHERARRQLLFYNEALNETISVSRFHPDRMLEAGVQLMRAGGADAGDPNRTFANLFRRNLKLEPLSPGELKEADVQEGLLSVQTIARWMESAVDRPPVTTTVAPRPVQPRGLLNRLAGFLFRRPAATPTPPRLRSERIGNQWVVSDSQGWRVALPILPVQTVDGSLFPAELAPGYLDVKWDGSIVTSYQGVAEDVPFERMVEMLEKLHRTTSANGLFPRVLGVQVLPGSNTPRLIIESFPEGSSFENLGILTPDADLDQRLSASFSPRLMERFRRGNFNLDQGIYLRHFYLINGEVRYRLPLENYALSRFFDYLNPRTNAPPAGAMPGVVRWLQGRGLGIAGAIRRAPLIESGLFSLAFLVPFVLTALEAEGATWAAGGVYGLMNAYFGLKHDRVYRNVNGAWTESPSTWKTKVWLAGVGAVIHLPLLLAAISPAVGIWGYVLGAGLSVGMHRLYNTIAVRADWAAATVAPPAPAFWKAVRSAQTSVFPTQPSDDELMRQRFLRDKAETALWDLIGTVSPERMVGILQKTTGFQNLQLTGNIEVEYFNEGVHKYVFKVTVERVTPQGAKENLSFLLAMKKAKAADSIAREEMKDLERLRGLGTPLFGGTFTAKRSGEMFFLEEFIEGFTGQQLKDQGLLTNEHRRKLAATLARIGERLGGKAPSDSTLKNFIIRQGAGHAMMVDIGSGRANIGPDASGFDLRIFLLGVIKHMTDEKSEDQVRAVIEGLVEGLPAAKARVFVSTLATELRRSPPVNNPGMEHARNILMEKAAAVGAPPAGAMPGVVDWLRARGLSTEAAVRHAPWIESGAFSIAFFVVLTLAMAGVDGGSWAASGVYGLMNAYFGYKHDTVFRFQNGNWVETRATWKTRLGLAGVGFAIHAPLLLSAWSAPFVGGLWFAVLYPFLSAASVGAHQWYNDRAKERGWAAATIKDVTRQPALSLRADLRLPITQALESGPNVWAPTELKPIGDVLYTRGLSGDFRKGAGAGVKEAMSLLSGAEEFEKRYVSLPGSEAESTAVALKTNSLYGRPLTVRGRVPAERLEVVNGQRTNSLQAGGTVDSVEALGFFMPLSNQTEWARSFLDFRRTMLEDGLTPSPDSRGERFARDLQVAFDQAVLGEFDGVGRPVLNADAVDKAVAKVMAEYETAITPVYPVVGEGSFFTVTDMGNGVLRKEVKEYVGPPQRLYRLNDSEREKAAALVVEYTNRIRRVVNEQLRVRNPEGLRNKNFMPLLRHEGRFIYVDKVDGLPFTEAVGSMSEAMSEEARRDIRGAIRAASDVFDLKYDQMLSLEDGWRIGVDNRPDNFLFAASGELNGWIDAISPWPPETHRVEPPAPPLAGQPGAVRVDYDGRLPRVGGWSSPLAGAELTDLRRQVAALLRGMPAVRAESREGYTVEVLNERGHKWPASYRGQDNRAHVFEIPANGKNYWVKIAFGLGAAQLADEAAGAAPAVGVPGVRAMVDFNINETPLGFSYVVLESPVGQPISAVQAPKTNNPVEIREAVLDRIEAIPAEQVRAAHETVRRLAERGVSVNAAFTRYDPRVGFVFEGLGNDADPLHQMAASWFPSYKTPTLIANEVVTQSLSSVTGVYPGRTNPYYHAAREKVAAATGVVRAADQRIFTMVVENLRRAWREQIEALRPGNWFPAGFSVRLAAQWALVMVGLLTATVDALAASVGAALGGKAAAVAHSLSFAGVAAAFAAGWRVFAISAGGVPTVETLRTAEVAFNPFGWRIDSEATAETERLGLSADLTRLLLGGPSRPVWLGFKDLRRSYRSTGGQPSAALESSFRAHLAELARGIGRETSLVETSRWGVHENEVFRAAALRRGQPWGGISLSRWAVAELVLATATPLQLALPWFNGAVRSALIVEGAFLDRGDGRTATDRLTRAARAIAVLRAAGFSLSSPNSPLGQDAAQEKDRRLLLNAAGVGRVGVDVVEDAYNAALEKIGATHLWMNAATAAFIRLSGGRAFLREGVPAGGPTGTLYFNVDALVRPDAAATEDQRGKIAESLEGVLSALSGEYLRDRLVLTTSLAGADADRTALAARLSREFGPSFRTLQDVTVLNETNAPALYKDGALRLSVLSDHAKGRGTGEFELWTHDAKNVLRDRPGLDKILVVDILDVAVKFDRMLRQMRFLATNA